MFPQSNWYLSNLTNQKHARKIKTKLQIDLNACLRSSVGQSCGLLSRGAWVRVPPEVQYNMPLQLSWLKLRPLKPRIVGSSPTGGTINIKMVELFKSVEIPEKERVSDKWVERRVMSLLVSLKKFLILFINVQRLYIYLLNGNAWKRHNP